MLIVVMGCDYVTIAPSRVIGRNHDQQRPLGVQVLV